MAATIEKLGREVEANKVALDSGGKQLLKDALAEERQCLQDGRYWRARTLLENHRLAQQVYNPALVFPPGLETLMDPARARLVRASSLPRAKDWIANIRFDRMDGTAIPVDSKLPLQASCEGSCELREGRAGKALHLDGKTGRVVLKGDGLELKDFTLTAWVSPEQGGMERKGIVMKQNGPAGYALLLWNGSVLAEAGSAAGNAVCRTGDGLIHPGAWYHLAVTVESGKAITLYVNGEEVKKAELKETISPVSDPFVIGWSSWGGRQNDPSPGPFFGLIDDLKVWARALTADEVLAEAAG
jgi:hypothetical protein